MAGRAPPGAVTRRGQAAQWVVAGREEDVRTPARPVVALSASSGPRWGRPSNRSSGHPVSRRPVSRRPVQPGVQVSGAAGCPDGHALVSAALPRCPRRAGPRSGSVWWAAPARRSGSTFPWSAGGVVACRHRAGREGMVRRWPWLARMRSTVARAAAWPASGCGAALAPAGPPGRWSRARVPADGGEPGMEQVLIGPGRASWQVAGVVADHGLDQEVVTTLGGRWARMVPCRPAPEDPPGSVGEQPAAAARPQGVRSTVG
jgi:hypothetical protein